MEIKISGATPQELYVNLHNIFLLVAKGGTEMFKLPPVVTGPETTLAEAQIAPPAPKPRGRPRKQVEIVETAASPETTDASQLTNFEILNDPVEANPVLTPECMLQRAKDIVSAHEKRGHTMQEGVAYLRKLYEGFGIKRVTELSPEQYGEFYMKAKPYLEGTAE